MNVQLPLKRFLSLFTVRALPWWGLAVVITAVSLFPHVVQADALTDALIRGINWILLEVFNLLGKLLLTLVQILIGVAQYNDFINSTAVTKGWIIIRDITNILFVVAMLATAFATITGMFQQWYWQSRLPMIIAAAVVVNFSKTIFALIIDAGQVLMLTFVNAFKDVAAGNITTMLGVQDMLRFRNIKDPTGVVVTNSDILSALLLSVTALVIACIVIGMLVGFFVERIIRLWVIMVFAPAWPLGWAFPPLAKYGQKAFDELIKWTFNGIGVAFMLWLAFAVMSEPATTNKSPSTSIAPQTRGDSTGIFEIGKETGAAVGAAVSGSPDTIETALSAFGQPDKILNFIVGIALLLMAQQAGKGLGTAAGKVGGLVKSGLKVGGAGLAAVTGARFVKERFQFAQEYLKDRQKRTTAARQERLAAGVFAKGVRGLDKGYTKTVGAVPDLAMRGAGKATSAVTGGAVGSGWGQLSYLQRQSQLKAIDQAKADKEVKPITEQIKNIQDPEVRKQFIKDAFDGKKGKAAQAAVGITENPKDYTDEQLQQAKTAADSFGTVTQKQFKDNVEKNRPHIFYDDPDKLVEKFNKGDLDFKSVAPSTIEHMKQYMRDLDDDILPSFIKSAASNKVSLDDQQKTEIANRVAVGSIDPKEIHKDYRFDDSIVQQILSNPKVTKSVQEYYQKNKTDIDVNVVYKGNFDEAFKGITSLPVGTAPTADLEDRVLEVVNQASKGGADMNTVIDVKNEDHRKYVVKAVERGMMDVSKLGDFMGKEDATEMNAGNLLLQDVGKTLSGKTARRTLQRMQAAWEKTVKENDDEKEANILAAVEQLIKNPAVKKALEEEKVVNRLRNNINVSTASASAASPSTSKIEVVGEGTDVSKYKNNAGGGS
ncbi:MAG: hypothetical protein V1707_01035 [bacterium]